MGHFEMLIVLCHKFIYHEISVFRSKDYGLQVKFLFIMRYGEHITFSSFEAYVHGLIGHKKYG